MTEVTASHENWLDRMYARLGPRYVFAALAVIAPISALATALNVSLISLYGEWTSGDLVRLFVLSQVLNAVGGTVALVWRARPIRLLAQWSADGEPAERAREAWETANRLPLHVVPPIVLTIMVFELPAMVYGISIEDSGIGGVSVFFIAIFGILETAAAAGLLAVLLIEQAVRPVARRALRLVPPDFVPPPSSISLRRKLLVGLPVINVMTAYIVVAFVQESSTPEGRLAIAVIGALLVSLTVSLLLTSMLSRSLNEPVRELVAATELVERGDLSAHVIPVAGDELGVLAGRFNRMLADLRSRTDELRESRARIVASSDAARRQVERDLHDGAQQHLVLLGLKLAMLERGIENGTDVSKLPAELRADLNRALEELRDLAHGIYPPLLENEGLPGALKEAAGRSAIPASVTCDGATRYPRELEAAVYFCCLEALQNASKHAGEGAKATVELAERDGALLFRVADDGPGFDATANGGGSGLQNMRDRIGALGGDVSIESSVGTGTRVLGKVPLGAGT